MEIRFKNCMKENQKLKFNSGFLSFNIVIRIERVKNSFSSQSKVGKICKSESENGMDGIFCNITYH